MNPAWTGATIVVLCIALLVSWWSDNVRIDGLQDRIEQLEARP